MLIRLLCAHEMTKHICEISRLNSKRLLRKLQKMIGATLFCRTLYIYIYIYIATPGIYDAIKEGLLTWLSPIVNICVS